jgi:hypothetical protein
MPTEKIARFPGTDRKVNAEVLAAARAARKPNTHLEVVSFDCIRIVNNGQALVRTPRVSKPRPRIA